MFSNRIIQQRDWSASPLPISPLWDAPRRSWHNAYPVGMPPEIDFDAVRVEQLLLRSADAFPERTALHYFGTSWSYQKLLDQVQRIAAHLTALQLKAGDRVMMVLPNCPEFVAFWFACHWIGVEVVPANPLLAPPELAALAKKCRTSAVVAVDVKLKNIAEVTKTVDLPLVISASLSPHLPFYLRLPYFIQKLKQGRFSFRETTRVIQFSELTEGGIRIENPLCHGVDRTAVLQPTGGTTGTPKVAVLTHRNLCSNVAQLHTWCNLSTGAETFLSVLPFFHIYGSTCAMLSPLAGGATLLLQARFDAQRTLALMRKRKPTVALLVPFMIVSLTEELRRRNLKLTGLKLCMSGASALTPAVAREFESLTGALVAEGYGLSETSPVTHSNPCHGGARAGSIGLPLPNTQVRLVDLETGRFDVRPEEVGELVIRGPQVMQGYLDDPAETAMAIRNGWFHTGDLARMDAAGFFQIVDRKKDMIKSGGLNVYPSEVERVVASHPAVQQCAVVGEADEKYGELVTAWVVLKPGASLSQDALREHCRKDLASYKIPRVVHLCDSLPKNFLGKVRRVDLRNRVA